MVQQWIKVLCRHLVEKMKQNQKRTRKKMTESKRGYYHPLRADHSTRNVQLAHRNLRFHDKESYL